MPESFQRDREADGKQVPDALDVDDVLDSIRSPLAIVDEHMRFVAVNQAYCDAGGRSRSELLAMTLFEAFPENPSEMSDTGPRDLREALQRVLATQMSEVMPLQRYDVEETPGAGFTKRFWSITVSPVDTNRQERCALVHAEEVTSFIDERLAREAAGQDPRTAGQSDAVDTVFSTALRHAQYLNDLATDLGASNTVHEVARAFTGTGLKLVGAAAGSFLSLDGDSLSVVDDNHGPDSRIIDDGGELKLSHGEDPFSDATITRESLFFDAPSDLVGAYPGFASRISHTKHGATAFLPLVDGSTSIGVLAISFDAASPLTSATRLNLFTLSNLVTQAASRARLREEQAEAMASLEVILKDTDLAGPSALSTSALYQPATALASAGGDWYDVVSISASTTLLVIGDIASHGPSVTGEMLRFRSIIRAIGLSATAIEDLATKVSISVERFSQTYATACLALYDATTSTLAWTTAGHPFPLVIDRSGATEFLAETHGPPLGYLPSDTNYQSSSRRLEAGDTVVFYTDGLIERPGDSIDDGFHRLADAATSAPTDTDLCDHLYQTLLPTGVHNDDVAILTFTVKSEPTDRCQ